MPNKRARAAEAMANNSLALELEARDIRALRRGGAIALGGGVVVLVVMLLAPSLRLHALWALPLWVCICLFGEQAVEAGKESYKAVASGLEGEVYAAHRILEMNPGFQLLNEVLLPNSRSRTGHTECDFVVLGRKAVYLVEVKNNQGTIFVDEDAPDWVVRQGECQHSMRNPIKQVAIQKNRLVNLLKERGVAPIVQPMVAFSSSQVRFEGQKKTQVPIFANPLRHMEDRMLRYEEALSDWPDLDQKALKGTLLALHHEALEGAKDTA